MIPVGPRSLRASEWPRTRTPPVTLRLDSKSDSESLAAACQGDSDHPRRLQKFRVTVPAIAYRAECQTLGPYPSLVSGIAYRSR
eukprot:3941779-Rhodomonas_salina.4